MTEEAHAAMMRALDGVKLDADMRAIAENATQHFSSVTAEPSAAQVVAESHSESDNVNNAAAGAGMDSSDGMSVAPMVPEPYHPVSPFRLKFTFGSDGSYASVTMEDPVFMWNDTDEDGNPTVEMKTASIGSLSLNGTIYLNITLSGEDGAKTYDSASVSMSSGGDIHVPLYMLSTTKGVVKDYRHALFVLGIGGGLTEDVTAVTSVTYNEDGDYALKYHQKTSHFVKGLLRPPIEDEEDEPILIANTIPLSSLIITGA